MSSNLQTIAEKTHGIVTPSNLLDVASLVTNLKYSPKLDTLEGLSGVACAYLVDLFDGSLARATGTTSRVGEVLDHAGDKVKLFNTAYEVAKLDILPCSLLGAVVIQNLANAGATVYGLFRGRNLKVGKLGKYSTFSNNLGLGLHIIGTDLERYSNYQRVPKIAKKLGTAVTLSGMVGLGIPATVDYWKKALDNTIS